MQPIRPDALPAAASSGAEAREALVIPLASRRGTRALNPRERRALELTARGLEAGEIAKVMSTAEETFVAEETVKSYQRSGRAKLGARSIAHAVAIALEHRLIQLDP